MSCCGGRGGSSGYGGGCGRPSCAPPPCAPIRPMCCGTSCSISPCCPAPKLSLCTPDCCSPCCRPMPPCPPRCPPNPVFPKVCCPPPCLPDPCIKPSRRCFIPPPCCPPPCCKKMALVVSPPICPPRCCPPLPCCEPDPCPDPCARRSGCCPGVCPCPAMIVRPIRNNCCPPPPKIPQNNQCPIPCCNPLPPCCVIVKPCQPRCPPSPCCPPPVLCQPACPPPDARCCPKPIVASFCCPTSQSPMRQTGDECPREISWPDPPKIDMCCSSDCPPRQTDICYMQVRPNPPSCCPKQGCISGYSGTKGMSRHRCSRRPCGRQCCRPRWTNHFSTTKCCTCFPWTMDDLCCFKPALAPVSCRYESWICSIPPVVDTNLGPSRFSSRVENSDCRIVPVIPPREFACGDMCPCHPCNPCGKCC